MTDYRLCTRCKQTKSLTHFGKNRTKPLGVDNACLPCRRIDRANYRVRQSESIKKQQADNYQRNKAKRIEAATKRIKENPDRHRQYMAISKKKNHIKVAADARRRRARLKQNGIYQITKKEISKLLAQPCFYCGSKEKITIDHVIAIARGGTDAIGNLVPACKSCNSQKRDLTITEWRKKREGR